MEFPCHLYVKKCKKMPPKKHTKQRRTPSTSTARHLNAASRMQGDDVYLGGQWLDGFSDASDAPAGRKTGTVILLLMAEIWRSHTFGWC